MRSNISRQVSQRRLLIFIARINIAARPEFENLSGFIKFNRARVSECSVASDQIRRESRGR